MNKNSTKADSLIQTSESLIAAVQNQRKVDETPHDLYRYPARFSPIFAREAIQKFTNVGDLVLDPFCGGGTTVVEAIRAGRRAIGVDVSSLAAFISKTKTTPISIYDKKAILFWAEGLQFSGTETATKRKSGVDDLEDAYYARNLPTHAVNFFSWMIENFTNLNKQQENFVRLILLSTGQWALDCKTYTPTALEMLSVFKSKLIDSIQRFDLYLVDAAKINAVPRKQLATLRKIIHGTSENCNLDKRIPKSWLPARLVLTSPPYPGVHVLYHRWQIQGRRETPAPFWLANQRDGAGEAFYTLGRRDQPQLETYYARLQAIFSSLLCLLDANSRVVQLIAFSDPSWQLPAYLAAMNAAGFEEIEMSASNEFDHRIWRKVPGRKWYANVRGEMAASKELLLVHRPLF